MKLSQLIAKTARATFTYAGEPVALEVRAQLITPDLLTHVNLIADRTADTAVRAQALAVEVSRLVASWDLLGDDGEPFPLEAARLAAEIPVAFLSQVLTEAVGAIDTAGEARAPEDSASAPASGAGS